MTAEAERLEAEGAFLFEQLFHFAPGPRLAERYRLAHEQAGLADSRADRQLLERLLALRLDVEALEFVLRRRDRRNALTRKLLILYYLAECEPASLPLFQGAERRESPWRLLGLPLRAVWLQLRGLWQLRRHGLA